MSDRGNDRTYGSDWNRLESESLSSLISMPNFRHAALIRSFTSDRVTPFIVYMSALCWWLMYDQAALACSAVSIGYLPFFGSAYRTSPYGFGLAMPDLPLSSLACVAGQMPSASW